MGVFLTLVFLLFPSWIFEAGYYETEFSNEMYNENLYLVVAVITAAVAWGGAALFYYVVNSVSFSRWYHWLLTLGVASVLTTVACYAYPNSVFSELGYDFSSQLVGFCLIDFLAWWQASPCVGGVPTVATRPSPSRGLHTIHER